MSNIQMYFQLIHDVRLLNVTVRSSAMIERNNTKWKFNSKNGSNEK